MIFLAVHNGQPKEFPLDPRHPRFPRSPRRGRPPPHSLPPGQGPATASISSSATRSRSDHLDRVIQIIRQSSSRADAPRKPLRLLFEPHHRAPRQPKLPASRLTPLKYGIDPNTLPVSATTAAGATLILSLRQIDANPRAAALPASPSSPSTSSSANSVKFVKTSPSTRKSSAPPHAFARSSPTSSPRSATSTAIPVAPPSSTTPPT